MNIDSVKINTSLRMMTEWVLYTVLQYYYSYSTLHTLAVLAVFVVSVSSICSISVFSVLSVSLLYREEAHPPWPRAGHIDRFYGKTFTADTDLHLYS